MTAPDKPQKVYEVTPRTAAPAAKAGKEPYRVRGTPAALSCAGCLVWVALAVGLAAFVMWQAWLGW